MLRICRRNVVRIRYIKNYNLLSIDGYCEVVLKGSPASERVAFNRGTIKVARSLRLPGLSVPSTEADKALCAAPVDRDGLLV